VTKNSPLKINKWDVRGLNFDPCTHNTIFLSSEFRGIVLKIKCFRMKKKLSISIFREGGQLLLKFNKLGQQGIQI